MKIIQHIDGIVVDIINARNDITNENIIVVDSVPSCEHRIGYNGILKYGENGLYWDYEAIPEPNAEEISDAEAVEIITGGNS